MKQFRTQSTMVPAVHLGPCHHRRSIYMIRNKLSTIALLVVPALLFVAIAFVPAGAHPSASRGWNDPDRTCVPVGGTILTNFGSISATATLGPVTDDLRGAV